MKETVVRSGNENTLLNVFNQHPVFFLCAMPVRNVLQDMDDSQRLTGWIMTLRVRRESKAAQHGVHFIALSPGTLTVGAKTPCARAPSKNLGYRTADHGLQSVSSASLE